MHIKIELENKKDDFVKIKQKALAYKNHHGKYPILYNEGRNENEIRLLEEKILAIDKEFQSGKTDQFCGIAFVVFATEDEKSQCLKAHYKTFKERAYLYFADNFKKVFKQIDETQLFFHDQRCLVFEAPEPSDVYWQNLHYTLYERYIRNIIADSFSIFILSCFGVGIYYLNYYQAVLNDNNKTVENLDEGEELTIKIIGSVISISVSLVIEILKILIPLIALYIIFFFLFIFI